MNFLRSVLKEIDYTWQTSDEIYERIKKNNPSINQREIIHALSNLVYEKSIEREQPGKRKNQKYRRCKEWFIKNRKWAGQEGIL